MKALEGDTVNSQKRAPRFDTLTTGIQNYGRTQSQNVSIFCYTQNLIVARLGALGLITLLSACGTGAVDCSSKEVRSTVLQQVRTQVENNPFIVAMYLIDKSDFDVKNIRTIDRSDRGASCAADLNSNFIARPEIIQAKLRESGSVSAPIKYTIQLTNDNRIYVTINP